MVTPPPAPKARILTLRDLANVRPKVPKVAPPTKPECYVILGRHGDIVNILPVLRDQAVKMAKPVPVVVSEECAPLFDGTSYIDPVVVKLPCDQLARAEEFARTKYPIIRTIQVWGDGQARVSTLPHYNENAWLMAGRYTDFKRADLRPVFDARSPAREQQLVDKFVKGDRPLLLLAARGGHSSPFREYETITRAITSTCGSRFEIVDLDLVRAFRIYDLIGLMEKASVLVTADSVHLHLAAACLVPTVAMLSSRNHWAETAPRCRVVWRGNYAAAQRSISQILDAISRCASSGQPVTPRVIHATDSFCRNHTNEPRHAQSFVSWIKSGWMEAQLPDPLPRNGTSVGCNRPLPFLKDILACGLRNARQEDIVVWTNSDTIVAHGIIESIQKAIKVSPLVTCRRVDHETSRPAPGRDLAAFSASWLKEHWLEIPDFICGAAELDNWMAVEARRILGKRCSAKDVLTDCYPADLPPGMVRHVNHGVPPWDRPESRHTDPANLYNLNIFREWCASHMPSVKFDNYGHVDWKK